MSVQEIVRNKKYRISVVLGYNGNKRTRHTEIFEGGKREALLRENEIKLNVKNHTYISKNKITVSEYFDEWLKHCKTVWNLKHTKQMYYG